MSSFTSVYTSLPSLYPSTLSSVFPSFIPPPSFPLSHPICSAQHPPYPHAPLTAYFCLICPHCKVDCHQRGESKAGPGSVFVIVISNVIHFNFQSFCPFSPVLQPPYSPFFHGIPIMGICQFCFSLCLSLSFILTSSLQTPIGYYPVSCLPQTSATQNAIFPRPHLWWDPNERSLIFCSKRNGVVSPILNIVIFPRRARLLLRRSFSPPPHQGDADDQMFPLLLPPSPPISDECICVHVYVFGL